eukprot:343974_1
MAACTQRTCTVLLDNYTAAISESSFTAAHSISVIANSDRTFSLKCSNYSRFMRSAQPSVTRKDNQIWKFQCLWEKNSGVLLDLTTKKKP